MKLTISKSKNAESFYISKGYINDSGKSTSVIVRKLGTLADLSKEHGPTREDVVAWAKEEAKLETLKYKDNLKNKSIQI
ncbi:MAG: transposase, partial [Clostridiales bacterium]|nr:transposase [Clostridiales bacterium]